MVNVLNTGNRLTAKTRQYSLSLETEIDEISGHFDLALSPEIMAQLYAKNNKEKRVKVGNAFFKARFALDEHELALA